MDINATPVPLLSHSEPADSPASEPAANGTPGLDGLPGVLAELAQRPKRDQAGKFIKGGLASGKTLERSEVFWSAVEPIKAELVTRVRADLAHDDAPETLIGLTDAYAEVRLFRSAMFLRLVEQGGPITPKGRARALYTAYLNALDRETKLATTLGLERRAKPVQSLDAYIREHYGPRGEAQRPAESPSAPAGDDAAQGDSVAPVGDDNEGGQ